MPAEEDLRIVHDVLESAFEDHFNSYEETFDEFVFRLREDPGHRWDHWWIAELVDPDTGATEPAGALVGAVHEGEGDLPDGSYVEYIGVLANARGRGVGKSLLATIIADAASRGRDSVGLEVDADSPTGQMGSTPRWAGRRSTSPSPGTRTSPCPRCRAAPALLVDGPAQRVVDRVGGEHAQGGAVAGHGDPRVVLTQHRRQRVLQRAGERHRLAGASPVAGWRSVSSIGVTESLRRPREAPTNCATKSSAGRPRSAAGSSYCANRRWL